MCPRAVPVEMALSSLDGSDIDYAANYNRVMRHSISMRPRYPQDVVYPRAGRSAINMRYACILLLDPRQPLDFVLQWQKEGADTYSTGRSWGYHFATSRCCYCWARSSISLSGQ